ncbi:RNA polymerase sigma factor [Actinomadura montaniterrae]|uniref:Sigma-70 family RNA polymerase sigma factor n=1 Tax=Actinomadura montaniterrae TaxID=1803903 RepID=A0A6L3W3N5_9ACTN|nr:sigma-70 family RNA polymerase sigma factor [Actinomadura montaniterrae]KAB2386217.1 sigma-70 family RNA polymerase sigma factor [Actinomadura montaniterrae]
MNDHLLVEALRERDAGAPADMYAAYADRLYAYCWFQLRERDAAQVALRDAFVVAEAHIGKLRDPDRFGPWLYAIARLECARRSPVRERPPDLPVASHDQEDVDQRITAWEAVASLRAGSREALELRVRHQMSIPDLAAIFDVPLKEAEAILERAHADLEAALTADLLVKQGPYGCTERARLLRQRHGDLTAELSERLLAHAQECATCGAFRPRSVSAAKVYGLLPDADPPDELRLRVMSCFLDSELVGYRLFVATRVTEFTSAGFPVQPGQPSGQVRAPRPRGRFSMRRRRDGERGVLPPDGLAAQAARAFAVLVIVAVLFGGGIAAVRGFFNQSEDVGRAGSQGGPRPSAIPGVSHSPLPDGHSSGDGRSGVVDVAPVSATFPLGSLGSSAPPTALYPSPPAPPPAGALPSPTNPVGALVVSPLYLDMAGGSDGSVELQALGGPVSWSAKTWGALRLSSSSGRLEAGQTVTVAVHASRQSRARGEGGITFQPGGTQVCVTWRADTPGTPGGGSGPTPTPTGPGTGTPSTPPETNRPGEPPTSSAPEPPTSSAPPASDPPPSDPPASSDPPPSGGRPDPPSSGPPASSSAPGSPIASDGSATPA